MHERCISSLEALGLHVFGKAQRSRRRPRKLTSSSRMIFLSYQYKQMFEGKLSSSLRRIGLICSSISETSWVKRNDWSCEALSVSLLRGYKCCFSADEELPVCGACLRVTDLHQPFTGGLNLCCCRRPLPHTFPHIETVVSFILSRRQAVKLKSRLLYLGTIHLSIQTTSHRVKHPIWQWDYLRRVHIWTLPQRNLYNLSIFKLL